jgi:hypothetical protein
MAWRKDLAKGLGLARWLGEMFPTFTRDKMVNACALVFEVSGKVPVPNDGQMINSYSPAGIYPDVAAR